jgi:hypothetical protein
MRKISVVFALLALVACGKKDDGGKQGGTGGGSAGSAGSAGATVEKPITCPPGNVIKDGACTVVVTAEKVAVVTQQQSRIDEVVKLLDKADTLAAPIDLMNGIRQVDQWKAFVSKNEKLKAFDEIVTSLGTAVEQLRAFRGGLNEASGRLENLKGELDRLLKDTGTTKRIEEVRALISSQVRTAVQPLAEQTADAIQKGLAPLTERFTDAANLMTLGCAAMALGRAGEKSKEMCDKATGLFAEGKKYLADIKTKPAALFDDITSKLESELSALLDDQARQLLDTAQAKVNEALRLPAAGAAPAGGSAAAPAGGDGSAAGAAPAKTP